MQETSLGYKPEANEENITHPRYPSSAGVGAMHDINYSIKI